MVGRLRVAAAAAPVECALRARRARHLLRADQVHLVVIVGLFVNVKNVIRVVDSESVFVSVSMSVWIVQVG